MNQYWRRKIYFKILFFFFISCRLLLRLEPVAGENEDEFSWTAREPETLSSPFEMINFISNKAKTNFTFCLRKYFCMIFAETTFFPKLVLIFRLEGRQSHDTCLDAFSAQIALRLCTPWRIQFCSSLSTSCKYICWINIEESLKFAKELLKASFLSIQKPLVGCWIKTALPLENAQQLKTFNSALVSERAVEY